MIGLGSAALAVNKIPRVGGSDTQIQFNDGGVSNGDSGLTFDKATNKVIMNNGITWSGSAPSVFEINRTITTPPNTPPGAVNPLLGVYGTFAQSGGVNQGRIGIFSTVGDDASVVNKTITGAANAAGLVRITCVGHGFATGDRINIYGITGTVSSAAHGVWTITVVTVDTFDLQSSTHSGSYTSGGVATNRGLFYAASFNVRPSLDRPGNLLVGTGVNGDDVACVTMSNDGAGKATDAIWVTDASISGGSKAAWNSILASDSDVDRFISYYGKIYTAGIDLSSATLATGSEPIMALGSGHNIQLDSTNGTKIGTSTSQKLGFFNATPVVQNTSTTDLRTGLINLGFFASGGASPLNLNGGILTAAQGVVSTGTITASQPGIDLSQTWNSGAVTFTGFKQNITNTASAATSLLFDWQVGGATKFNMTVAGAIVQTGADGGNPSNILYGHGNGSTAAGIASIIGRNSFGTAATPFRTQTGQVVLRMMGSGFYNDTGDATLATERAAHAAAIDWVAGANDWTSTDNGMFLRFRTTADGSTSTAVRAYINEQGITIGATTANRGTTQPTNALNIFDGTAPVGTLTNGISLYSTAGELRVMDAAGNATLLSPHEKGTNNWIYDSVVTTTGKRLTIEVERLLRDLNTMLGGGYIHESVV